MRGGGRERSGGDAPAPRLRGITRVLGAQDAAPTSGGAAGVRLRTPCRDGVRRLPRNGRSRPSIRGRSGRERGRRVHPARARRRLQAPRGRLVAAAGGSVCPFRKAAARGEPSGVPTGRGPAPEPRARDRPLSRLRPVRSLHGAVPISCTAVLPPRRPPPPPETSRWTIQGERMRDAARVAGFDVGRSSTAPAMEVCERRWRVRCPTRTPSNRVRLRRCLYRRGTGPTYPCAGRRRTKRPGFTRVTTSGPVRDAPGRSRPVAADRPVVRRAAAPPTGITPALLGRKRRPGMVETAAAVGVRVSLLWNNAHGAARLARATWA